MRSMYGHCGRGHAFRLRKAMVRLALSWTDGFVEPDIDYPEFGVDADKRGYTYQDSKIYKCISLFTRHILIDEDGVETFRRHPRRLYSKKIDALKSMRAKMELDFANRLLEVDELIEKELSCECVIEE